MERELIAGTLDLAIAHVSEDTQHVVAEKLFDEELVLIVGSRSNYDAGGRLPMRRIVALPLVLLTREFAARQFLDDFLRAGACSRRLRSK